MSDAKETGCWKLQGSEAYKVLEALPSMGKLMVIFRQNGVTHERIGNVETAKLSDGILSLNGPCHDSDIQTDMLVDTIFDTRMVMNEKTYPRLEFTGADGEPLVSVVGWEGAAPFEAAVDGIARTEIDKKEREMPKAAPEPESDVGQQLLEDLAAKGEAVEIRAECPGFRQSWSGVIEAVKPAGGFANVMTPDFHLHLKFGAVSRWEEVDGRHYALDAEDQRTGLSIGVA